VNERVHDHEVVVAGDTTNVVNTGSGVILRTISWRDGPKLEANGVRVNVPVGRHACNSRYWSLPVEEHTRAE
jgi:hypothetical protein